MSPSSSTANTKRMRPDGAGVDQRDEHEPEAKGTPPIELTRTGELELCDAPAEEDEDAGCEEEGEDV